MHNLGEERLALFHPRGEEGSAGQPLFILTEKLAPLHQCQPISASGYPSLETSYLW